MRALIGFCGLMLAVSTLNVAAAYAARVEVQCQPVVVERCPPLYPNGPRQCRVS